MCCLNGAAGTLYLQEEKAVKELLYIGALRGEDSTGIFSMPRNTETGPTLLKALGGPWELADRRSFQKVFASQNIVYIGHNRSATRGSVLRKNAHPFQFDSICGAHNGTVHSYDMSDLKDHNEFQTDSECILSHIDRDGVENTIPKIAGAWALVWYDIRDNTINFLRNKERSLYFAYNEDKTVIFWASEVGMLHLALDRNNIKRDKNKTVFYFTEDKWYSFEIPEQGKPFGNAKIKDVAGKPKTVYTYGVAGSSFNYGTGSGQPQRSAFSNFGSSTRVYDKGKCYRYDGYWDNVKQKWVDPEDEDYVYSDEHRTELSDEEEMNDDLPFGSTAGTDKKDGDDKPKLISHQPNRVPMVYRSPTVQIFYDTVKEQYLELRHNVSEGRWVQSLSSMKPQELLGVDLDNLIKDKKIHSPATQEGVRVPTHWPKTVGTESFRYRGRDFEIRKETDPECLEPWIMYDWLPSLGIWRKDFFSYAPNKLPFSLLDVDSRHEFIHRKKGRRKPKTIYYRGFRGQPLLQHEFNKLMEGGCSCCGRQPQWLDGKYGGTKVYFFSKLDFLCEFCGEDKELLKGMEELTKKEVSEPTKPTIN